MAKKAMATHEVRMLDCKPEDKARAMADVLVQGTVSNALILSQFSKTTAADADLTELVRALRAASEKARSNDLGTAEAMLMQQAAALNSIFGELAVRAAANMGHYVGTMEIYMRMALKAQAQCRTTIETLAEIKNPRPIAFVKQANISGGHQQVNNGMQPAQQAGAVQGGGGAKSLPAPEVGTDRYPTQGIFPPGAEIQTAGKTPAQKARRRGF